MRSIVLWVGVLFGTLYSQDSTYYFYHRLPYGSEALYNPLFVMINGGYDVLQFDGMQRRLSYYPYYRGGNNVVKNLSAPFAAINRFGVRNFLHQEVLPLNFSPKKSAGWPNYNLHLIGGGMTYAALGEWYEQHGMTYPKTAAAVTVAAEHLLNETIEATDITGDNIDAIADVYLFDLGGIILFSIDGVQKFFGETLNMRDWSFQPMFSVRDGSLRNNGQYFSMKWKWFDDEHWHLFYFFGLEGLAGTSYRFNDGTSLSGGFGFRGKKRSLIDQQYNRYAVDLAWNVGLFYDKNNSLLVSLFFSDTLDDRVTVNMYPGVVTLFGISPGAALIINSRFQPTFGITLSYIPGVAITQ